MAIPATIAVGRVVRPWGRHGAMVIEPLTHDPERFRGLVAAELVQGDRRSPCRVASVRIDPSGRPIVTLEGVASIDQAEALRGARIEVPEGEGVRPAGRAYFNHELLGLEVWTSGGESLGRVAEVLETGATNVLVVRGGHGGELLLPAAEEVLGEVDLAAGRLTVVPPPGLLELNRPEAKHAH